MNRFSKAERAKFIGCLVEGNSIRANCRMTGADKGTVIKLLADVGAACKPFHHENVRNVPSRRVQCDEIWSFCYSKEKIVPADFKGVFGNGDVWTRTAICADTKLIISYHIGDREIEEALKLMDDLRSRLANRVQLTTDGHKAYFVAVNEAFDGDVDYAMLHKTYSEPKGKGNERRYIAAECGGTKRRKVAGNPVKKDISTSFVERQNLGITPVFRTLT